MHASIINCCHCFRACDTATYTEGTDRTFTLTSTDAFNDLCLVIGRWRRSAGVAPQVNLMNLLHAGNERRDPLDRCHQKSKTEVPVDPTKH